MFLFFFVSFILLITIFSHNPFFCLMLSVYIILFLIYSKILGIGKSKSQLYILFRSHFFWWSVYKDGVIYLERKVVGTLPKFLQPHRTETLPYNNSQMSSRWNILAQLKLQRTFALSLKVTALNTAE